MVTLTIAFLWVISLWISTPPALGWNNQDFGYQDGGCVMTKNQGYVFHSVLGSFIIPIFAIILLYYKIYVAIKAKLRKRARPVSMMGGQNMDNRSHKSGETSDTYSSEDLLEQKERVEKAGVKSVSFPKRIKFSLTKFRRSIAPTTSGSSSNNQEQEHIQGPTLSTSSPEASQDTNADQPIILLDTDITVKASILRKPTSLPLKPRPASQVDEFVRKKIKFSLTKERRAVKTLGVIIGSFLVCWVPFCIMYLIDAFLYPVADTVWFEICTWMGYINSAMNPFIYSICNKDFRTAFSKILFFWKKP